MSRLTAWLRRPKTVEVTGATRIAAEIASIKDHLNLIGSRIATAAVPNSPDALFLALSEEALASTVQVIKSDMPSAALFVDVAAFHTFCLSKASRSGAHCEFGVFAGQTINFFANLRPDVQFEGFDSFEGLPEEWSGYLQFDFNRGKKLPVVRENVRLHVGWFSDTLPDYVRECRVKGIDSISFLHIDCDLYSSTVDILTSTSHLLMDGTLVLFDEYFCYPGYENHEMKAFKEFCGRTDFRPEWVAVCGQRAACYLRKK